MVLLSLIARQRSYGYELISRLQREGGGLFQETKEGTLTLFYTAWKMKTDYKRACVRRR